MRNTLERVSQDTQSMHWMLQRYSYANGQIRKWEDAIRRGVARTQRKNDRIEHFLQLSPICPGENCGGHLKKTEINESDKVKSVIGPQYDVKCEACNRIIYLPPVLWFTRNADDYLCAARVLGGSGKRNDVAGVTVFLLHQAAELYLKGLGTCTLYDDLEENDDSEDIGGESLRYTPHNLPGLFQRVYPSLRAELEEYEQGQPKGDSVESLVNAVPSQTAEMFRYGFLLRGEYAGEVTFKDGDVWVIEKNISKTLLDLCTRLGDFSRLQVTL